MATQNKIGQRFDSLIKFMGALLLILAVFFYFIELPLLSVANPAAANEYFSKATVIFLMALIALYFYVRILPIVKKKADDYANRLEETKVDQNEA